MKQTPSSRRKWNSSVVLASGAGLLAVLAILWHFSSETPPGSEAISLPPRSGQVTAEPGSVSTSTPPGDQEPDAAAIPARDTVGAAARSQAGGAPAYLPADDPELMERSAGDGETVQAKLKPEDLDQWSARLSRHG